MQSLSTIAQLVPNLLFSRFRPNSPCCIHRLPLDIHVDNIFIYLAVEDIICLRRVDKAFFLLTHEPVIWKRFLRRMNIPVPPFPPTKRYSFEFLDYEAEQLVTRAISVDDNWRRPGQPRMYNQLFAVTAFKVLDMTMVPGGKYLVASVRDNLKNFYVTIFFLDHPSGPQAVARLKTPAKAYHLQAKYMTFDGKDGIMIGYVSRVFKDHIKRNFDPSDFSNRHETDSPIGLYYDVICMHVALTSIENLADPRILPGSPEYIARATATEQPFHLGGIFPLTVPVNSLQLFMYNGNAHIAVPQSYAVLVIDMDDRVSTHLLCHFSPSYQNFVHEIRACKVLPSQDEILVIREVRLNHSRKVYLLETFAFPFKDSYMVDAKERIYLFDKDYHGVHISNVDMPKANRHAVSFSTAPPPPISIFFETANPYGVDHYAIYPTRSKKNRCQFRYSVQNALLQSSHVSEPDVIHVVPGGERAIMYTAPKGDRTDSPMVHNIRRYISPEVVPANFPMYSNDDFPITRKNRPLVPKKLHVSFSESDVIDKINELGGISSIAFDESIGRVCVAADRDNQIHVIDYSSMVHPDSRAEQWRRQQFFLNNTN